MKTPKFAPLQLMAVLAISLCGARPADAAINYTIDTVNKLIILNGTATGTPSDFMGLGEVSWIINDGSGSGINSNSQSTYTGSVTSSASSLTSSPSSPSFFVQQGSTSGRVIAFSVYLNSAASTTLTFTNATFDYSGFNATNIAYVDALAASTETLSLSGGSGFGELDAIPEPACGALALLASGLLLRRRR